MKNLTKIVSFTFIVSLWVTTVSAQENRLAGMPAEERAALQTQRMRETLELDSLQLEKVAAINLGHARRMDPVIAGSGSRLSKLKAYRQISAAREKELQQVLTQEQFREFKQQQQEMKEQLKKRKS